MTIYVEVFNFNVQRIIGQLLSISRQKSKSDFLARKCPYSGESM